MPPIISTFGAASARGFGFGLKGTVVPYDPKTFVAVSANTATGAYSTDGTTWTGNTMPSSQYWYSVTFGNGKFVAVAYGSTVAAYSTDGINWTASTMPSSQNWYSVIYG